MIVTIKLSTHTRFWSCLLLLCIIFLSLGLYILYMWISNYFFSIGLIGTTWMSYQTISTYLVVLFCTIVVLVLDGIIVFCDFFKAGYISKMRQTVREEQVNNAEYYSEINLTIT